MKERSIYTHILPRIYTIHTHKHMHIYIYVGHVRIEVFTFMNIRTNQIGAGVVDGRHVPAQNVLAHNVLAHNVPLARHVRNGLALRASEMRKAKAKLAAAAERKLLRNVEEDQFVIVHSVYPTDDGDSDGIVGIDVCRVTENQENNDSYMCIDYLSRCKSTDPKVLGLCWVKPRRTRDHESVIEKDSVLATFDDLINKKIPTAVQRYFIYNI